MEALLQNIGVGVGIAALEIAVVTFVLQRAFERRLSERWMPFRRHTLQVLYEEAHATNSIVEGVTTPLLRLSERLKEDRDAIAEIEPFIAPVEDARSRLSDLRLRCHQAIQTGAAGITPEAAERFANIFRALDAGPTRLAVVHDALHERNGTEGATRAEAAADLSGLLAAECWKVLKSAVELAKGVEGLLTHEQYLVIDGLVATREDLDRLREVEALEQRAMHKRGQAS